MYGYIYITTNLINNKKYIGKHKSSTFDENYKGSGKLLWRAINKYGWENFSTEIIKECESLDELNQSEINEIKKLGAIDSDEYYNIKGGGEGWQASWQSSEFRQMMKERFTGDLNPAKSESVRKKMSENHADISGEKNPNYKGKSYTEHQRQAIIAHHSVYYRGKGNPMYGRRGENSPHYNKIHVNNGIEFITIPKDEFEKYQSLGYVKTKNPGTSGRKYVNNGINSICIQKSDIEKYLLEGWTLGKNKCPILRNQSSSTIESISNEKDITE